MEQIEFQINAVDKIVQLVKNFWARKERMLPIVFKAPTGSGKTYMTEKLICDLAEQPDWDGNVAYVWITFTEDLALQSKEKFDLYFPTTKHGRLLTIEDFNLGKMQKNDVLFLNWQKLVNRSAENRIYRRPTDERMRHESRIYFEDFVENTHKEGVEIILIIDESHLNVTNSAYRDVINPLNPKIILNVSATPKPESIAEALSYGDIVKIDREDVVAQGLIKESIICQTEEELKKYESEDMDHILIKLAMDRRKQLKSEIEAFGKDVNPLVIIQLPNDDEELIKEGLPTKEEIVREYLVSQGVRADRIASWFTGNKKPVGLENNNSPYEYLLFKTAAGTGWDCPRAQILVMFRDVKSEIFNTQVVGRIMRVPIMNEEVSKVFRNGYIYTNFSRDAVEHADYGDNANKPKVFISRSKKQENYTLDSNLMTDFISRVDYGDLGKSGEFQQCLIDTFNAFFNIKDDDSEADLKNKLLAKGVDVNAGFSHDVISDTELSDFEKIAVVLKDAHETNREWSINDVQKWFSLTLVNILKAQTDDDCKVGNIVRSIPALKSAVRLWFKFNAMCWTNEDSWYRVFLNDVVNKKEGSVFRLLITKTLKNYHPILEKQLDERRKDNEQRESEPFVLKDAYGFTEEYEEIPVSKSLLTPFFLKKEYLGRKTEEAFAKYLDQQDCIEWWIKNGDSGKDWFAIRYYNEINKQDALFYPDWIYMKKDGTIGIFDTKNGITASDLSTKNKAEALHKRIAYLNSLHHDSLRYEGGIINHLNGMWYYNDNEEYSYQSGNSNCWKELNKLFL